MKRIKMISVAVLVAAVMVMGVLARHGSEANAQAAPKTESKPSVIVGGLSIARAKKDDKFNRSMAFQIKAGTNVSLYVSMPGKTIIQLDRDASMLTKFTDDKGTVLAKPGSGKSFGSWLGTFPHIADDAHSCAPSVRSKKLPAAGASALTIDATLAFICGDAPKTAQCDVSLTEGTAVKLGMVAANIIKVGKSTRGKMKFNVTFTSSQSFDSIRKLVFLDSAGKEIKSRYAGGGKHSAFGSTSTYSKRYELEKKVDKVTIKIDYWRKIESVTVPLKLNVGLGL
jgi:hypothetical protein